MVSSNISADSWSLTMEKIDGKVAKLWIDQPDDTNFICLTDNGEFFFFVCFCFVKVLWSHQLLYLNRV